MRLEGGDRQDLNEKIKYQRGVSGKEAVSGQASYCPVRFYLPTGRKSYHTAQAFPHQHYHFHLPQGKKTLFPNEQEKQLGFLHRFTPLWPWQSGISWRRNTALLKWHVFFWRCPCPVNTGDLVLWVTLSPALDQPLLPWTRAGIYFQIFPEFKLTLAKNTKTELLEFFHGGCLIHIRNLLFLMQPLLFCFFFFSWKTSRRQRRATKETRDKIQRTRTDMRQDQKLKGTETN